MLEHGGTRAPRMRWRRLRLDLVIKLVIIIQHILVSLHNLVMAHVTQKV